MFPAAILGYIKYKSLDQSQDFYVYSRFFRILLRVSGVMPRNWAISFNESFSCKSGHRFINDW